MWKIVSVFMTNPLNLHSGEGMEILATLRLSLQREDLEEDSKSLP